MLMLEENGRLFPSQSKSIQSFAQIVELDSRSKDGIAELQGYGNIMSSFGEFFDTKHFKIHKS